MKKIISIIAIICLCTTFVFADEEGDEYDDGYVYEQNGSGDQFLNINLAFNFPLNFDEQINTGFGAGLGYFRFIDKNLALGGDLIIGYNVTVGQKALVVVPITFGVLYQPYIGKFEFPLTLSVGFATSSCQGMTYFPSFSMKTSASAFFRIAESWSAGVTGYFFWIPQWFSDSSKNDNGFFATAGLSARYHF